MVSLADLVRGAGESDSHDWKEDLRRPNSVSGRGIRTRLQRIAPASRLHPGPKSTGGLTRLDIQVLRGLAAGKAQIQRPRAPTKKNFKRENPAVRFISDTRAARFLALGRPGQSYADFLNRQPAKVTVTPMGRAFRAVCKSGDPDQARVFHTGALRSVILKTNPPPGGKGAPVKRMHTSTEPRYPGKDETWIPLHVYAACKVDS